MRRAHGYTLIEFLLYIAISTILLLVSSQVVFTLLRGRSKLSAATAVSQNGRRAMERIRLSIRNANTVTTPADGTTSTSLILQTQTTSTTPTTFTLTAGAITIQEGTGFAIPLTSADVTISSLLFQNLAVTNSPDAIRVSFTVSSTNPTDNPDFAYGDTFFGSASVRSKP